MKVIQIASERILLETNKEEDKFASYVLKQEKVSYEDLLYLF